MARVGIVWHSSTGYTRLLAESVARGAAESGAVEVIRVEVVAEDITAGRYENDALLSSLDSCDALIFGCPTFMGSVSAQMKAFMDACLSRWYERTWSGKVGAAFTTSATPSGDKLNTLLDLCVFAMQMGMIWVGNDEAPIGGSGGNRLGVSTGMAAQPDYEADSPALMVGDDTGGELLGARVAALVEKICK